MKMKSFLTIFLIQAGFLSVSGQTAAKFYGSWEGKLSFGSTPLTIVFNISDNGNGGLISTADSPDQNAFGMKCDTTWFSGKDITIEMKSLNAAYKGRLVTDTSLVGSFTQGASLPLMLTKTGAVPEVPKRPQEPKAPFPYKSEDVVYKDPKGTRQYGATITIPSGNGPFPAALLITGSGPQDRDEELFGHKPFAVLADALTRNGFVVLRVDDRGVGKTTGTFQGSTTADFAGDARISLQYLMDRPEVDKSKTGMIGHSEGGLIAPMVAANRNDINFIILLAGPGVKISQLLEEQNAAISRQAGISEPAITSYLDIYTKAAMTIVASKDSVMAINRTREMIREWKKKTDAPLLAELRLNNEKADEQMATALVSSMRDNWFRHFYLLNPANYLQKVNCKVLALNGSKDIQVVSSSNLPGIEASLKKSKSSLYEVKELPGLNHLFQTCKTCSAAEYGQLEETFSPIALQEINNWLNKNVK